MYYYPSLIITITFKVVFKYLFFSCSSVWYTLMPDTAFLISIFYNPPISKHLDLFSVYRMQPKSYFSFHWRSASGLFSTCFLTWSLHSVIWTCNTHFWIVFVYAASVTLIVSACPFLLIIILLIPFFSRCFHIHTLSSCSRPLGCPLPQCAICTYYLHLIYAFINVCSSLQQAS